MKALAASIVAAVLIVSIALAQSSSGQRPPAASSTARPLASTSPSPAVKSLQPDGRFQLVSEYQGSIFLIDSETGRVWRYTRLVIDENDLAARAEIDQRFERRRNQRLPDGRMPSSDELRQIVKAEYEHEHNPCHGAGNCFLEVDRLQLTPNGWTTEVLK